MGVVLELGEVSPSKIWKRVAVSLLLHHARLLIASIRIHRVVHLRLPPPPCRRDGPLLLLLPPHPLETSNQQQLRMYHPLVRGLYRGCFWVRMIGRFARIRDWRN